MWLPQEKYYSSTVEENSGAAISLLPLMERASRRHLCVIFDSPLSNCAGCVSSRQELLLAIVMTVRFVYSRGIRRANKQNTFSQRSLVRARKHISVSKTGF